MDGLVQSRDRAYLDLLHHGLVRLRNLSHADRMGNRTHADRMDLCRVEAEHLHEMPTLVGETNERRHVYYLNGTRRL
jgi:hypothetical protein